MLRYVQLIIGNASRVLQYFCTCTCTGRTMTSCDSCFTERRKHKKPRASTAKSTVSFADQVYPGKGRQKQHAPECTQSESDLQRPPHTDVKFKGKHRVQAPVDMRTEIGSRTEDYDGSDYDDDFDDDLGNNLLSTRQIDNLKIIANTPRSVCSAPAPCVLNTSIKHLC